MFVDQAEIFVRAGNGGQGCASFRRERYMPRGGPDGGDGGHGGSVVLRAVAGIDTLLDFAGRHHWTADNGRPGQGQDKTGRSGCDLIVKLPPGTLVYDKDTGLLLKDLAAPGVETIIAAGGKGGKGNVRFASSTNQTPREFEPGQPGERRALRLELKLIADVGVVGLPNAGKSTLLSRLSKARPKIADYPFTTLQPQLGIVELSGHRRFVMADLPGLIEGAHQGTGLGDAFLRHIERTRVILHLVDVQPPPGEPAPDEAYRTIRRELQAYSELLAAKPEIVAANKIDLLDDETQLQPLGQAVGQEVLRISAVTGQGINGLTERLWALVGSARQPPSVPSKLPLPPHLRPADDGPA
ncbi:MAG: GTPase ObgE [Planctomycetes bacterium]|nr:GTPase ObgE [Planctomycetota bacterium]